MWSLMGAIAICNIIVCYKLYNSCTYTYMYEDGNKCITFYKSKQIMMALRVMEF